MSKNDKPEKSALDKFLNVVGLEAVYSEPEKPEKKEKSRTLPSSLVPDSPIEEDVTGKSQIILIEPEKRSEAQKITDYLKAGKTVVVNVEKLEKDDIVRLWDFVTGASYALEGKTEILNEKVLITAPHNVDIRTMESASAAAAADDDLEEEDEYS